jgi:hypothetical protein
MADESQRILATIRRRIPIHSQGIILCIRGEKHVYFNERTGNLVGKTVLVSYRAEEPGVVTVYNPELHTYFTVPEIQMLKMNASPVALRALMSAKKAHLSGMKRKHGLKGAKSA